MMKRRVVVTGMGCVTPLGNDVESMWQAQKECRNGVGQITHFDASRFPTRFAEPFRWAKTVSSFRKNHWQETILCPSKA